MEATALIQNGIPMSVLFNQIHGEIAAFFTASIQFIPGNGSRISFWNQNWGFGIMKHILPYIFSYALETNIPLLTMVNTRDMNENFRPNLSITAQSELATMTQWLATLMLDPMQNDEPKWKWTTHGEFTVQSVYRALKAGPLVGNHIRRIWKIGAAPRMLVFGWLVQRNRILTHDNLKKKRMMIVSRITLCKRKEETVKRLLQHCEYTRYVYNLLQIERPSSTWLRNLVIKITDPTITNRLTGMEKRLMLIMQFVIWQEQCARVSTHKERQPTELIQDVIQQLQWSELKDKKLGGIQGVVRS